MAVEIPPEMQALLPRGSNKSGTFREWEYNREFYDIFKALLREIVEEQRPMTVRQVFYRAVVKGYVEKSQKGYGFIQRDLVKMRWEGTIPFEWIIDSSRQTRGWQGHNQSVEEFLDGLIERVPYQYSLSLLADYEWSIQVWLEKEALAGVIWPMCREWNVPLYCARGYASLSFLHEAARDLEAKNRGARIFHFGDYDPSGQDAILTVQRDLIRLAPKTAKLGLEFVIVTVTPEQIQELALPTRPTKKSDTRAWGFGEESVELDAIEPDVLRQMVTDVLQGQFPDGAREENRRKEKAARKEIREWLAKR